MKEDGNIERFFKKRLETNEFSYQEKDWKNLEEKLDAAGIVPPVNGVILNPIKLIIVGILITSVAFMMGWYLRESDLSEEKLPESALVERVVESGSPGSHVTGGDTVTGLQGATLPNETAAKPTGGEGEKIEKPRTQVPASRGGGISVSEENPQAKDEQGSAVNFPKQNNEMVNPSAFSYLEDDDDIAGKLEGFNKPEILPVHTNDEEKEDTKLSFRDRWAVGLSFAPDMNSVGLTSKKSISQKFGLQVFYRISDRWTISTGSFYNKKKYETDAEGYSPPSGYWYYRTGGEIPNNIIGSCGVVDVPVKVYYQIATGKRFNFYGSIGVSNYFLLDEAYDFEFDQSYSGQDTGWYTEENSQVFAGIANISVAMGVKVSKRSDLLLEPYLQTPLTKIGWGNIDLYSTGALLTWRYRLAKVKNYEP